MKVLWLTLQVQWQRGIQTLRLAWLGFRKFFIDLANKAFYGAVAAFEIAWHGLQVAWIEATAFLSKTWAQFTNGFQQAWNVAINWVAKRLLELQGLFDSSFDVDAAKKLADQELQATNRRIEAQKNQALAETERQREQRRRHETQTHEQTLAKAGKQYEDARQQLEDEYDAQRQKSEDALANARKAWEDAMAEAAKKRAAVAPSEDVPFRGQGFDIEGLDDVLKQAVQKTVEVRGTFNAAAIQSLLSSRGTAERTAAATEETARNTKRIERQVRNNTSDVLTFA